MNWSYLIDAIPKFVDAAKLTLELSVYGVVLSLLFHQIGGFLGSYIGGIVITRFNDYGWMWYADAVLAGAAALLNLLIHERKAAAA